MTIPITGFSATVKLNDGASNAQTAFVMPAKIKLPFGEVKILDYVTTNQSDRIVRKIPGMVDPGTFEFSMFYCSADAARLVAVQGLLYITGSTFVTFQVVTSDATPKTYTIPGIVQSVDMGELDPNGLAMTSVKVAVSGPITIA